MISSMVKIILYYKLTPISNVKEFIASHRTYCKYNELKGRIYVSEEGINGTLAVSVEAVDQYEGYLRSLDGFQDTEFKEDFSDTIPFAKMIVKHRPEIVSIRTDMELNPGTDGSGYMDPT